MWGTHDTKETRGDWGGVSQVGDAIEEDGDSEQKRRGIRVVKKDTGTNGMQGGGDGTKKDRSANTK